MTPLAPLVLSGARTLLFFIWFFQSELVRLKGLAALCVAPERFMTLAQSFPLILTFLWSYLFYSFLNYTKNAPLNPQKCSETVQKSPFFIHVRVLSIHPHNGLFILRRRRRRPNGGS